MEERELQYRIALTFIPGVGHALAKALLAYCGSPEAVFKEKKSRLLRIPYIGQAVADAIRKQDAFGRAEKEITFIKKHKIQPLFFLDDDYPRRLKHCPDYPVMLYYNGNASLNNKRILSIVGTRNATRYGMEVCRSLIAGLSVPAPLIVSGLAYGIDICAHREALQNSLETVGVLGHGLDRIYPLMHKEVAGKMLGSGGLLTEYPSGTKPDAENFPMRNRIIAGLADAVLVVEAGESGGALITAELANGYNREVFAVPGRISDSFSVGCNALIKQNKAMLISTASDIENNMGWDISRDMSSPGNTQMKLFAELTDEEKAITRVLSEEGPAGIDSLCMKAGFTSAKASSVLLSLEFAGIVKSLPGKIYKLL